MHRDSGCVSGVRTSDGLGVSGDRQRGVKHDLGLRESDLVSALVYLTVGWSRRMPICLPPCLFGD